MKTLEMKERITAGKGPIAPAASAFGAKVLTAIPSAHRVALPSTA